jgi:hypothetical protein
VRAQSEFSAIDILLVEQIAANDTKPINPATVEHQLRMQKAAGHCLGFPSDRHARESVEWNLRLQRTAKEMTAKAIRPTESTIEAFYLANRENFRGCAVFEASHVVKHINQQQTEGQARAGIEAAFAELEDGTPFADVVLHHSDCKDNAGDLGPPDLGHLKRWPLRAAGSVDPVFCPPAPAAECTLG